MSQNEAQFWFGLMLNPNTHEFVIASFADSHTDCIAKLNEPERLLGVIDTGETVAFHVFRLHDDVDTDLAAWLTLHGLNDHVCDTLIGRIVVELSSTLLTA